VHPLLLPSLALLVSVCSLFLSWRAVQFALYRTGDAASSAKFAEIEAELTDQSSALQAIRHTLTKIRARLNAATRRQGNGAGEYDLNSQIGRDQARLELERELAAAGRLTPGAKRR